MSTYEALRLAYFASTAIIILLAVVPALWDICRR